MIFCYVYNPNVVRTVLLSGILIYAALSKQYAVFTNISENIFVQGAKLFLTSRCDEKEIRVAIVS